MRRVLPFPLLSFGLLAMWLLLNQSMSPGHLILGTVLAVTGPLAMRALELPPARFRGVIAITKLFFLVVDDIVRSNNAVARIILSPTLKGQTSNFVDIPLELRSPYGLTMLAIIVTSTPGTLWSDYDARTGVMTLHVLDLIDEQAWVDRIKQRYESLLLEIFE